MFSPTSILTFLGLGVVFGIAFFVLGYFFRKKTAERKIRSAEIRAEEIRVQAERERLEHEAELSKNAEKYLLRLKQEYDEKQTLRRRQLDDAEQRLAARDRTLDEKDAQMRLRESENAKMKAELERALANQARIEEDLKRLTIEENERLQRVAGLTIEEAKRQLLKRMETEVRTEASRLIKSIEEEAVQMADKKAKKILALAIQRCAAEHSIESTVSVVTLPSEEMKGRIIGKEGRNIRTFENTTGVDLVIDDTPGAVIISAFDPVRREVARQTLERLIEDGRIHPSSIEETVGKVKQELDQSIRQEGEGILVELGLGDMHPELIKLLGRLKYRTSYGQNALLHSKEVAHLMNVMAGELGLDPVICKRAGLLHDIGKAVTHEVEGPHALIGGELARRYGEPEEVVHGIEAHHSDIDQKTMIPILVQAADAVSGARPGARRESFESYIKRLDRLEKVAASTPGVERVYAIQAGREVRVMVHPGKILDNQMPALAREITKKVEATLQFPGQIRVTVIRETRATEFARSHG